MKFVYLNFSGKNDVILLKNSAFRDLIEVLMELIFWFIFQFSKYLPPRVIVQSHLKSIFDF